MQSSTVFFIFALIGAALAQVPPGFGLIPPGRYFQAGAYPGYLEIGPESSLVRFANIGSRDSCGFATLADPLYYDLDAYHFHHDVPRFGFDNFHIHDLHADNVFADNAVFDAEVREVELDHLLHIRGYLNLGFYNGAYRYHVPLDLIPLHDDVVSPFIC